jgi:nucleotide-binding universal stress UspA family protein
LPSSEEIVAAVVSRPWPPNTFARIVTAIELAAIPEKIWQDADGQIAPVKQAMLRRATDVTIHVAEQLERSGISTETIIKIDEPRFVILREADEWPADLVLIRAHTYTNFSRWLLGSVSGAVLRDAACSVEIVRTTTTSAELAARNGLKILIGIDGSAFSLSAARSVAARPWPSGTIVKLLSVEEPTIHLAERVVGELKTTTRSMLEASTQAEAILSFAGLSTTSDIVKGNPKEQIIRHAAAWGTDLVVVGSHGRRGVKRWLLGSVSEAVARHAYCSVEVIRTHHAS